MSLLVNMFSSFELLLILSLCISLIITSDLPTVVNYDMSHAYNRSTTYSLSVNGKDIFVTNYYGYDYAHFSLDNGRSYLTVSILPSTETIQTYRISPFKYEIKGNSNGNHLNFSIINPKYLIVKVNHLHELIIVADPLESQPLNSSSPNIINIVKPPYNADSTGKTLSHGIQQAIHDANQTARLSIVFVPKGVYLTPNLYLKSNVKLYLEGGAVLRFTGNPSDYRTDWFKLSMKINVTRWISTEYQSENITIFGRGTIDGNGKISVEHRIAMNILVPIGTTNFLCDGLVLRESGSWSVTPIRSSHVYLSNMKVFNRFDMGENDAFDVMESQNVTVQRAIGIALDDSFSTKTWTNTTDICQGWPGQSQSLDGVTFEDCLAFTFCYGFKIGQGVFQNQRQITFENSVVYDAAVGLGISHQYGSASVENATFQNIDIERLSFVNDEHGTWLAWYVWNSSGLAGSLINLNARNITIYDQGKTFGVIRGLNNNSMIHLVELQNITMINRTNFAKNFEEMNIWNRDYVSNVTILPVYSPDQLRTNLALHKNSKASSSQTDHPISLLCDGDLQTRWTAATTNLQWIDIDLGASQTINSTRIFWEQISSPSYSIEISQDNINWKKITLKTQTIGDITYSDFPFVEARYVLFNVGKTIDNSSVSIWEIQIFGR